MVDALTPATCLEHQTVFTCGIHSGSQGISPSICVQAAASAAFEGEQQQAHCSQIILSGHSARRGHTVDFSFIAIFGKTLQP